jgi:molybdate transport system substrate-binding protein
MIASQAPMTRVTKRSFGRLVDRFVRALLALLVAVLGAAAGILMAQTRTLTVAAAADVGPALREIVAAYERRGGARVTVVLGASGTLMTQIEHGAPYDVFMSADMEYPHRLESQGIAVLSTLAPYAVGSLVLWAPKSSALNLRELGWKTLSQPGVRAIAIANPEHAPYGKAAVAALRQANLFDAVKARLVLGENVAQAAQFVTSGNAQVGIIPLSLAVTPELTRTGQWWEVPPTSHPAIMQGAVVLRRSRNIKQAEEFLDFLKTAEAAAIFRRNGFKKPEGQR